MTERDQLAVEVASGDRRRALVAIRDRLAAEADDTRWAQHKDECHCECGLGDGRTLVAVVKVLVDVIEDLDKLPAGKEVSKLDQLADRRARRIAEASGT